MREQKEMWVERRTFCMLVKEMEVSSLLLCETFTQRWRVDTRSHYNIREVCQSTLRETFHS